MLLVVVVYRKLLKEYLGLFATMTIIDQDFVTSSALKQKIPDL